MKISVVIPTYNRADLLLQTLDSVWAQTRPADEIVVIDDGSTDDTRARLEPLADAHRLRYVYQTNAHLSAARNRGTRETSGDALLFLDSDDLLFSGALAALEAALTRNPDACLAYCRTQVIGPDGEIIEAQTRGAEYDGLVWPHLLHGNFIRSAGSVLVRRNALEAAGPFDETLRGSEDWDEWLRVSETGKPFALVRRVLFKYRSGAPSLSTDRRNTHETNRRVYEKLRERHADNPARLAQIEAARAEYERETRFTASGDFALAPRHQKARAVLEKTGLAALYRRTPYGFRLFLRRLAGVGRRAS